MEGATVVVVVEGATVVVVVEGATVVVVVEGATSTLSCIVQLANSVKITINKILLFFISIY